MKTTQTHSFLAAAVAQTAQPAFITPDSVETRLGTLKFKDGVSDADTTQNCTTSWITSTP